MRHYTMLSKYGNCTRLLKICLLDMTWLKPTLRYRPRWLSTIHIQSALVEELLNIEPFKDLLAVTRY